MCLLSCAYLTPPGRRCQVSCVTGGPAKWLGRLVEDTLVQRQRAPEGTPTPPVSPKPEVAGLLL